MQDRKVTVKEKKMTDLKKTIEQMISESNEKIEVLLEAAAMMAQSNYDRVREHILDQIFERLGDLSSITEQEFYSMFLAIDSLAYETDLCEEVGLDQTTMYRWREKKLAPENETERRDLLRSSADWVMANPEYTGEQVVGVIVQDLNWAEAYPER